MTAALFYSAAPLTLGSTTLAADDLGLSPSVDSQVFRHSGNLFPSVSVIPGAEPRFRFKTPFYEAYAAIGLKSTKFTTCNLYFAKFVDAVRQTSGVHRRYALASSAIAHATIKGANVSTNGILMADVEIVFLSADGTTHPWSTSDAASLPSLSAEPALRTMGPATINGTTTAGYSSCALDLGNELVAFKSDGDLYPRVAAYTGGSPTFTMEHQDPATLYSAIGLTGAALTSNFIWYARDYSTSTHLALATGLSFTVANAHVIPVDLSAGTGGIARGGLRIGAALSTDTTHPVVVATGASVPTP
jgi:hypothetical protein